MTEDLTNKLNPNTDDMLALILTGVQDLTSRVGRSERKFDDFTEKVEQRLQKVSSDIAQLKDGQGRLEQRMGGLEQRMDGFGQRMGGLEQRMDGFGQRMGGLEQRMGGLEEGQESLRSDLTALRKRMDDQFLKLSGEVEKRYRDHDRRITRLEANANPANSQT